ncbi:MAG: ATP-binding cassette domain-containing protein, partial [Arcanobacterium sp.]|nr:ATP-binding cassette domain-containing protein [Arcanobacterium sp.]
ARKRALQELALVGLTDLARRPSTQLSGGQAQRVAIARAMAIAPDVVLLDEPFAGLDERSSVKVRAELRQRLSNAGVTAVLVTHDVLDAEYLASELVLLRNGRVAERRQLNRA